MTPEKFYEQRLPDWTRLTELLDLAGGTFSKLSPSQVEEIGRLYRNTTSDLAIAQRDYPNHDIALYLNQLTGRAHAAIYRGEPLSMKQVRRFFTHVIPQNFRDTLRFTIASMLMFFLPAVLVGFATAIAPETAEILLPTQLHGMIPLIEAQEKWFEFDKDAYPVASAEVTTNNIRVSILAFVGGMTVGLLTFYVLILNGLMLGGVMGLAIYHDFWPLLHFVVGHGVIELSVICFAGGAGLMMAWAIINPAPYNRSDALAIFAVKALILLVTSALFLIVAGLIEGFISPRPEVPPFIKYIVGIGSGAIMYAYLLLAGRSN